MILVIVVGVCIFIGKLMGFLKDFSVSELGVIVIKGVLEKVNVLVFLVEYVIMGQVLIVGVG